MEGIHTDTQKVLEALEYYADLVEKQQETIQVMAELIRKQSDLIAQYESVNAADSIDI